MRQQPSKALRLGVSLIDVAALSPVIDIGCGNGRNAIFLAQIGCVVQAVDASSVAIEHLRREAAQAGVAERINITHETLGARWPFSTGQFRFAVDSYVSCHLVDENARSVFLDEMRRIVRPRGLIYSSTFSLDDEYYASFLPRGRPGARIVQDPQNGISKHLYSEDEVRDTFARYFTVVYQLKFAFDDIVCDTRYRRSVHILIMQR